MSDADRNAGQPDDLELDLDVDLELQDLDLEPDAVEPAATLETPSGDPQAGSASAGEGADADEQDPPDSDLLLTDQAEPPVVEASAGLTPAAQAAPAAAQEGGVEGMWVWQYGAPPPPPAFSAVFFSGAALTELYRFFACGVLVAVGCLLPWRAAGAEDALVPGVSLPAGAVCLVLALWLIWSACYGIYTRQQKILPVFLMLVPTWISWSRTREAWGEVGELSFLEAPARAFELAGTGVLLALIGSSVVAVQLLLVVLKVLRKKPAAGAAGRARADKAGRKPGAGKQDSKAKMEKREKKDKKKGGRGRKAEAKAEGSGKDGADAGGGRARRKRRR